MDIKIITFDEYQAAANKYAVFPDDSWKWYIPLALCGEAAELADKLFDIPDGYIPNSVQTENILLEAGDVLWYISALMGRLNSGPRNTHSSRLRVLSGVEWTSFIPAKIMTKTGRIAEVIKKTIRDKSGDISVVDANEILFWCDSILQNIAEIAGILDHTLSDVAEMNLAKLQSRLERDKLHGKGDRR